MCVQDGRKLWHKTDVVSKSLNPVWTLPTGSFFFIKSNLNDFFGITTHIEFVLKDNSIVGKNSFLGSCLVNKTDLLNGKGDRVCFPLTRISRAKKEALTSKKKVRSVVLFFNDGISSAHNACNNSHRRLMIQSFLFTY